MEKFTEKFFLISAFAEAAAEAFFFGKILKQAFFIPRGKKLLFKKIFSCLLLTLSAMQLSFGIFDSLTCLVSPLLFRMEPAAASLTMMLFNVLSICTACIFYKIIFSQTALRTAAGGENTGVLTALTLYLFAAGLYINSAVFGSTADSGRADEIFLTGFPMLALHLLGAAAVFAAVRNEKRFSEISFGTELAEKRAEQAAERLEKTAAFRHDAKRHIAVLSGLLKKGSSAAAEKYLSEIGDMADELSGSFSTGCAAADTVLESALCSCGKFGIRADFRLRLKENSICTADLCGVLSNILDNAVNACLGMEKTDGSFIRLRGGMQGGVLFIESENSFDGRAFQKGTGLMSIERAVKKYGGNVLLKHGDGVFSITVIMNADSGAKNMDAFSQNYLGDP